MRRFFLAGLLILFGATAVQATLTDTKISVRIKNLSAPATYGLSYTRGWLGTENAAWPFLGYIGKEGLTKDAPPETKRLGTGDDSGWVKLPSFGCILHIKRQGAKPWRTEIEVQLQGDKPGQPLTRKIAWDGEEETLHLYLFVHPVAYKPDVLGVKTFDELMQENEECVQQTQQECPWKKAPRRLAFYSDVGSVESDGPAIVQRQLDFLREVGFNGLDYCDPPLFPLVREKGFSNYWGTGWPCEVFTVQDPEKLRSRYNTLAQSLVGPYEKYGALDMVRGLQIGDENSNGKLEDYLNGGEKSRAHLVGCLQALGVPPSEFGFKDYSELQLASAKVLRATNPALFYWANRVRMETICDQWKLDDEAYAHYFPKAWGSPDWALGGYISGGYDQQGYDQWMLYRRKALRGVWGETWVNQELTAFLVDMMNSQGKGLPFGVFEICEGGFTPLAEHYKAYEELIRGATHIAWYSYGGLMGIEGTPWQIKRDMVREITLVHREAGEAEPYLLDTQLEPAKVALLWTPAQEIWEPGLHNSLTTTYFALLHANYAFDILSSYDVEDGLLDRYKVLYMPYDYVEKRVWEKIRQWTERGGSLVLESGNPCDEYNRPMSLADWLPGFHSTVAVKGNGDLNIFSWGSGLGNCNYGDPLIEKTKPVPFPVVYCKTVLTAPKEAQVLLTYANGQTAAFSMPKGNGRVTVFGFHPGAAYAWDEAKKDKFVPGEVRIVHDFSAALREAVTAPVAQAGIERVCGIREDMVMARRRVGGGKECVALFDYGYGQPPEHSIDPDWANVKERRVQVQLTYSAEKARSLRGEILSRKGNTVEVAFHGLDMILVDEK